MGYTNYFEFSKIHGKARTTELKYHRALLDCQRVIKHFHANYGKLSGYSAHTTLGEYGGINVNGNGDDGHETFTLREHFSQNESFNFCKTERKPYDLVVKACLTILAHRLGNAVRVSSDGSASDWHAGLKYAREVTGLSIKNPIVRGRLKTA